MGWKEINIEKYVAEVKRSLNMDLADEIVKKDLLLTLILAEMEKKNLGKDLIFKGGTLLSRNYLKYHRFSEDLDFVYKDSNKLRLLTRRERERKIKSFIDIFCPRIKEIADELSLEFNDDRSKIKFCTILHGRTVYTFRVYYSETQYIKIEINFIEKIIHDSQEISIRAITDFFDSRKLMFDLNLSYNNFKILSYPIEEIILEKYRAILTRKKLQERDIFDLYLIPKSLDVNISQVVDKIASSSLIKKQIKYLIESKLKELHENRFFTSTEKISDLAIAGYDLKEFNKFKDKIKPILVEICEKFMEKNR